MSSPSVQGGAPASPLADKAASFGIALFFCGYGLVSFSSVFAPGIAGEASIAFRALCVALTAMVVLTRFVGGSFVDGGMIGYAVFWAVYALNFVIHFGESGIAMTALDYAAHCFGISMVAGFMGLSVRNAQERLVPRLVFGMTLLVVFLAFRYGADGVEITGRLSGNERLNPISFGHASATLYLVALCYLLEALRRGKIALMAPFGIAMAVGAVGLVSAASRGPIVAAVVATGVLLVAMRINLWKMAAAIVTLAVVARLVTSVISGGGMFQGIAMDRFSEGFGGDISTGRFELWELAWGQFWESPLTGGSLIVRGEFYSHNLLIDVALATGGGVLTIFVWLMARALRRAWAATRLDAASGWALAIVVQAFVGSMFSGSVYEDALFWGALGLGLGLKTVAPPAPLGRMPPSFHAKGPVR